MKPLLPFAALILVAACDMPPSGAPYSRAPIAAPVPPPAPVETRPQPTITVPSYQPDPAPNEPPRVTTPGDTCGASGLQGFVGSVAPSPFPAAGPVRVYAEGDPVTMDHNPSRVNVVVDGDNRQRVVAITCG